MKIECDEHFRIPMSRRQFRRWLRALRSGEYVKAKGTLAYARPDGEHGFCCLGVLANETPGCSWTDDLELIPAGRTRPSDTAAFLNPRLFKIPSKLQHRLATWNDATLYGREQYSHRDIADWLEGHVTPTGK
jgi:hypothetical protein